MTARRALRALVVGSDTKCILGADGEGSAVGGGFIACWGSLAEAEMSKEKKQVMSDKVSVHCVILHVRENGIWLYLVL